MHEIIDDPVTRDDEPKVERKKPGRKPKVRKTVEDSVIPWVNEDVQPPQTSPRLTRVQSRRIRKTIESNQ